MKTPSVIVVGAGPGGLAAAMLLAKAGVKVTVIERQHQVGGRTSAIESDGFRFDLGPTFFLYPQSLDRIFSLCGLDMRQHIPMVRLDPQYRLLFGDGGKIDATPDVESMRRQIAAISPGDAQGFARFMDDNRVKLERFRPVLESPFLSFADLLAPQVIRSLPWLKPWRSLDDELGKYFRDPRLRLAFSFQAKYLGMSPFRCPSLFSILSFLEYEHGVYHPIGGCNQVTRIMAELATKLGADVRLGQDVKEVLFEGRKAVGVRTEQGELRADAMVINADFARAMTRLVPDRLRKKWTDKKLAKKKFSCSTYMLYLGIEGTFDDQAHHTIYMSRDYRQNLHDIEQGHVLSDDPSVYVQNACVTDRSLAPQGMSTLYVLSPVTHQHDYVDWSAGSAQAKTFRERVMGQVAKMGFDDVSRRVRFERVMTPLDWDRGHQIHLGATFNLAHSLDQMLLSRPGNRFEDLDAVYLVGGGTHPGSGLPVIFESARISTELLLNDLGQPRLREQPRDEARHAHAQAHHAPRHKEPAQGVPV